MRRGAIAAVLLVVAGAAAFRVGPAGLRREPSPAAPEIEARAPAATKAEPTPVPPPPADPLAALRGNPACDRILALEHRVRLYRKALELPTDEWVRLLNLIRISAGELWEAPPVAADAERAFVPGAFEQVRATARELSSLAGDYYQAGRTRNAAAVALYRPAFEERWASFQVLVRQGLRR